MLLTGSGSPPTSARPIRLSAYSTSLNSSNMASSFGATEIAVSRLADGASVTRRLIVPSSSSGTNSVPNLGSITAATISNNPAIAKTLRLACNAFCKAR